MILVTAAAQTATIDPTLLTLLSIFGAVGVTTIAAVGLAFWQSKRDHARWVRERRYEGLTRILALADRFAAARLEGAGMMARWKELDAAVASGDTSVATELRDLGDDTRENIERVRRIQDELGDVAATLEIIGPNHVLEALNVYTDTFAGDNADATARAKDAFVAAARKALKIRA